MKKVLNLGCGPKPDKDAVNVDILPLNLSGYTFVRGDFNKMLPFDDEVFEKVFMSHALEHCENILFTLSEIRRVLKEGGRAEIIVPYFRWPTAFSPLTHHFYFTWRALDKADGFSVKKRIVFYSSRRIVKLLTKPLEIIVNRIPLLYETSILSTLIPAPEIRYELTKK
jgi:SAM-dependent methyltransferase